MDCWALLCCSVLGSVSAEAADALASVIEHYGLEQAATPVSERPAGASRSASWSAVHSRHRRGVAAGRARRRDRRGESGEIAKQAAGVDVVIGFCTPEVVAAASRSAGSSW